MPTFHVEPTRATLHGNFSRDHAPILTVGSGDTVVFRTLDGGWHGKPLLGPDDADEHFAYGPADDKRGDGHALCGPVFVTGAEPGATLEIRIDEVIPGNWGWTNSGGWPHRVHERLGTDKTGTKLVWSLDPEKGLGLNQYGHEVSLRPFMGVMGMPPAEPGLHSTVPPRMTGGNLDCKELVTGTSLFLPVAVTGGLFSVGDGHAVQGDGEACVTAIECPMERVALTFFVRPEMRIRSPRARLDGAWMTMGLHEDLDEACLCALEAMVDLMQELRAELDRATALALASLAVDLRVTQIVNDVQGVHAILRDDAIRYPRN